MRDSGGVGHAGSKSCHPGVGDSRLGHHWGPDTDWQMSGLAHPHRKLGRQAHVGGVGAAAGVDEDWGG